MRISRKLCPALIIASAAVLVLAASAAAKPSSEHPFEIAQGSFHMTPSTGQAAAHENLTTEFDFTHNGSGQTYNDVRSTVVNLPAGFDASNTAVPTCSPAELTIKASTDLELPLCPPASTVGTITLDFGKERITVPIYNMEVTSFGVTAQLGFKIYTSAQILTVNIRPGDSGLTVTDPEIENLGEPHNISVTIWGVPASHEHDLERQQTCHSPFDKGVPACQNQLGGPEAANIPPRPYLSNPTGCEPHIATMDADSWEHPGTVLPDGFPDLSDPNWSQASVEVPPIGECDRVPFNPSIEVQPSTRATESPTGLSVSLVVPQSWETPITPATANLKDTAVALPEGVTINPSAGSGLGACTPAQYEAETSSSLPGEGCPPESKIGSIEIETPVLGEKILGAVYVATPFDNPFDSLLSLYIVAKAPASGIIVKVAGKIEPNPVTGQLTTTFENTPQQPFNRFTLKFRPGATAPLVSPPACGSYSTQATLTPWSTPLEPRLISNAFQITQGVGEGPCPAGGVPPFHPGLTAGSLNNSAGSYSQMDIHIARNDGEQEITRFSSILPPGLTANLTGIPFCPNADIEAAKEVSGAQEEADPSCPAASEIGHTLVGAGVGPVLAYTPGKIYLAGPYNGAPFSVVSITSAKVGPFDLGTVVIRFALEINPETGVVTVDAKASDPIPHIIKGIIIHVRDIHVYIDRPNFMINPTNCDPLNFAATVGGGGADPTNPADQQFVTTNDSFQLANCQNLQFKPKFSVSTSAKTSRADGASLTAKLMIPAALGTQANISKVKVELPEQLPSRLTTLQKACTSAQFDANPAGCPPASIIGHAKAITPILPVPLEGPAYFVSHGGEAFPDLEIVLQGYGVTIDLTASTFISKAGITSSTFKTVPDEPVTSFELTLPEGPYSALTALGNLCTATTGNGSRKGEKKVTVRVHGRKKTITRKVEQAGGGRALNPLQMPTEFVAQNGAEIQQNTPIAVTGCPKARPAKRAKSAKHKTKGGKKSGK